MQPISTIVNYQKIVMPKEYYEKLENVCSKIQGVLETSPQLGKFYIGVNSFETKNIVATELSKLSDFYPLGESKYLYKGFKVVIKIMEDIIAC